MRTVASHGNDSVAESIVHRAMPFCGSEKMQNHRPIVATTSNNHIDAQPRIRVSVRLCPHGNRTLAAAAVPSEWAKWSSSTYEFTFH